MVESSSSTVFTHFEKSPTWKCEEQNDKALDEAGCPSCPSASPLTSRRVVSCRSSPSGVQLSRTCAAGCAAHHTPSPAVRARCDSRERGQQLAAVSLTRSPARLGRCDRKERERSAACLSLFHSLARPLAHLPAACLRRCDALSSPLPGAREH